MSISDLVSLAGVVVALGVALSNRNAKIRSEMKEEIQSLHERIEMCEQSRDEEDRERHHLRRKLGHMERHIMVMDIFIGQRFPTWKPYNDEDVEGN